LRGFARALARKNGRVPGPFILGGGGEHLFATEGSTTRARCDAKMETMNDESHGERFLGLPEAAKRLGLHRATVNEMVVDGRLNGERIGPHWFVKESVLNRFASSYERPKNAPKRGATEAGVMWQHTILEKLAEWHDAGVQELSEVIDLHPGNIRKYLCLLEVRDLAQRDEGGMWSLTAEGQRMAVSWVRSSPHTAPAVRPVAS
jgi:excisionase family DNA binding protein